MNDKFKCGDVVTAKCADGSSKTLVVWECGEKLVWLSSRLTFDAMTAGLKTPPPIGFPIKDVTRNPS